MFILKNTRKSRKISWSWKTDLFIWKFWSRTNYIKILISMTPSAKSINSSGSFVWQLHVYTVKYVNERTSNLCSNWARDQSFIMWPNQYAPKSKTERIGRNDSKTRIKTRIVTRCKAYFTTSRKVNGQILPSRGIEESMKYSTKVHLEVENSNWFGALRKLMSELFRGGGIFVFGPYVCF